MKGKMNKLAIFVQAEKGRFVKNAEFVEKNINFAKSLEKTFIIYYNIGDKLHKKQRDLND